MPKTDQLILKPRGARKVTLEEYGLTVYVRPEMYDDVAYVLARVRELGTVDERVALQATITYSMISRIVDWEGPQIEATDDETGIPLVENGGPLLKPAPCTMDNKQSLFGEHPEIAIKISAQLAQDRARERKNSKTSHGG